MDASLLEAVMGPIFAALSAAGHKALSEAEDGAGNELVGLGRRLLGRLRWGGTAGDAARPQLVIAARDVASDPGDEDFRAALRGQIKNALSGTDGVEDPALTADLAGLLEAAGVRVSAVGSGSVAVVHNEGIISTAQSALNTVNQLWLPEGGLRPATQVAYTSRVVELSIPGAAGGCCSPAGRPEAGRNWLYASRSKSWPRSWRVTS